MFHRLKRQDNGAFQLQSFSHPDITQDIVFTPKDQIQREPALRLQKLFHMIGENLNMYLKIRPRSRDGDKTTRKSGDVRLGSDHGLHKSAFFRQGIAAKAVVHIGDETFESKQFMFDMNVPVAIIMYGLPSAHKACLYYE